MVRVSSVPPDSLLGSYKASGAYTDCFVTDVPFTVTHAQLVETFYTTPLFKLERLLLALFISRPSTDAQAQELAEGRRSSFAAWTVEGRAASQILLAAGRTRSWLMVAPIESGSATRLYFGSAVVPQKAKDNQARMGFVFSALLGFHKLYSRALLWSAKRRLLSFR